MKLLITFLVTLGLAFGQGRLNNGTTLYPSPNGTGISVTNDGTTGTTLNKVAKYSSAGAAIITATTDAASSAVAIGIVVNGAGTSGSAYIVTNQFASCVFDGATTLNHYVQMSSTVAGDCHDAGATYPTSGEVLGQVTSTNVAGGTYVVDMTHRQASPSGGGGGSGTVTNVATGCGLTGGPISTTGTISISPSTNSQIGTTYTVVTGDCGNLVTFSNAANVAVTLPQAGSAGFQAGWSATFKNVGTSVVTITPTTSSVDGVASMSLGPNQSTRLISDGTNYWSAQAPVTLQYPYWMDFGVNPLASTTYYIQPMSSGVSLQASTQAPFVKTRLLMTKPGTFTALSVYVDVQGTLGSAGNVTYNLYKNGAACGFTVGIAMTSATPSYQQDTSHVCAVVVGDYIQIQMVTPAWTTVPTNIDQQIILNFVE